MRGPVDVRTITRAEFSDDRFVMGGIERGHCRVGERDPFPYRLQPNASEGFDRLAFIGTDPPQLVNERMQARTVERGKRRVDRRKVHERPAVSRKRRQGSREARCRAISSSRCA